MNIVFRLDATKNIGAGHLSRCKNLADFLLKRGAKISFIARDMDKNFKRLLTKNFKINFLPNNDKFKKIEKNNDKLWPNDLQKIDASETKKILKKNIDWVIVDHYGLNTKWEKEIKKKTKKIMVISDFLNRKHYCDLFIFQNETDKREKYFKKNFPKKCKFLIGSEYALINKNLILLRNKIKKKNGDVKKILINFGSVNPSNLLYKILVAFKHRKLKKYNLTVLGTSSNIDFKKKGIKFFGYKKNFVSKLNKFDFCIGSGGVANLERMCIGLPSLVFPISSNQIQIVKILEKRKISLVIKNKDVKISYLRNKIISILKNKDLIKNLRINSYNSVDGYGIMRVVEALYPMKISKLNLRKSKFRDSITYYKWVNDEKVIKSSFKNKRIKFEEHLNWFQKKIKSKKTKMFILESGNLPVGQIRFDLQKNKTAMIDYSLDSIVRNRGWGKKLVNLGIKKIYKEGVKKITAEVRPENIKSITIFKKLGFLENKFKLKHSYTLNK